jgi:FxsC-like protein
MSGDKPFDIVIAALHLADLPDGRARDYYAADVSGWNPYVPDLVEPLAQYARKVAQYCGHRRPRVFSLLDYQSELLRSQDEQASAPAVLLIDPWVVTQPDCRRLLEAYDKMTKPWIQFIIAWSARDAAAAQTQNSPRGLLRTVLKNKLGDGGRPARQVASIGVPTIEEMQAVLPSMIRTAGRHFVRLPNPPPAAGLARS